MHDSFASLLKTPTAQRYKRARLLLLTTASLTDFSLALAQLEALLAANEFTLAQEQVRNLKSAGLLSLKWHRLAGMLALQLGDTNRAQLHKFTFEALRSAILATGQGTRKRPYFITYSSDAHELLLAGGASVQSQSLVEEREHRYDVHLCANEREYWFDITDLVPVTAMVAVRKRRPKAISR